MRLGNENVVEEDNMASFTRTRTKLSGSNFDLSLEHHRTLLEGKVLKKDNHPNCIENITGSDVQRVILVMTITLN